MPESLAEFEDCFGELGCLPEVHHINLKPDIIPVVYPPWRIPCALRDKLRDQLQQMEKLDIIEKVLEPIDWVNSLVIVSKPNGKRRICIDLRDLNKAIKCQHFQLPLAEDCFAQISGTKYFAKLDMSNVYWQIRIDEESSKLLNFITPFGRFKFKRLPFGIHSSSGICQEAIARVIEDVDNCANEQVLNLAKCIFEATEITYLGHILSGDGMRANPKEMSAIRDMPAPCNKEDLQFFLGMIKYLDKFLPDLGTEMAPLRLLLEKGTE